jgi:hypothetical protein
MPLKIGAIEFDEDVPNHVREHLLSEYGKKGYLLSTTLRDEAPPSGTGSPLAPGVHRCPCGCDGAFGGCLR